MRSSIRGLALVAAIAVAAAPATSGAAATSTDTATGIAAGLGLTAATGKTTLGSGAGAIEASLLTTDAVTASGAEIRRRTAAAAGGRPVLLLARSDSLDLATVRWVSDRIDALHHEAGQVKGCASGPPPVKATGSGVPFTAESLKFAPADITAALASDVTINAVTVTEDDRVLISAVAHPAAGASWAPLGGSAPAAADTAGQFLVPAEIVDVAPGDGSDLLKRYIGLQADSDKLVACTSADAKAAVANIADFVKSVSSAAKGPAPIMLAAELYDLEKNRRPLVLRVAIEQVGGTSVTRANIWYTLGFPGAATISSGLVASYRLADPTTGAVLASGLVRCLTKPVNFRDVDKALPTGGQSCSVSAGG